MPPYWTFPVEEAGVAAEADAVAGGATLVTVFEADGEALLGLAEVTRVVAGAAVTQSALCTLYVMTCKYLRLGYIVHSMHSVSSRRTRQHKR